MRVLAFCAISLALLGAEETACVPKVIEEFDAKVVSVTDGDTLRVLKSNKTLSNVRLEGIDAPEGGQEHSDKAKQALSDLVKGKTVTICKTGVDRYDRVLAYIKVEGSQIDVNERLVRDGWAWQYVKYNCEDRLEKAEQEARKAKRGLWAHDNPMAPWDYRDLKSRKTGRSVPTDEQTAPAVGQSTETSLDHWLNTSSNVRHNSGCKHFKNTKKGRLCGPDEGKACGICGG